MQAVMRRMTTLPAFNPDFIPMFCFNTIQQAALHDFGTGWKTLKAPFQMA